ncbi:MAG: hypothetical protein KME46_15180 [Brasilonema angustatum HA4187-MV1]|jgi:hypothetical protein|nr:hypothetical protein [Brasilonema angustatum HA4187-MV1]
MTTTTTTSIEQQSLQQDFTRCLIENNVEDLFKVLNIMEVDLDGILVNEFEPGLLTQLGSF